MRPLEILLAVATISLALFALSPWASALKLPMRILAAATVVALAIQAALEGPHWQLGPLYLACLLLFVYAVWQPASFKWVRWPSIFAGLGGLALVAGTIALSWSSPLFRLPEPTGSLPIGTRIWHVVDTSRPETGGNSPTGKREFMVQAWYPASLQGRSVLAPYQRFKELTAIASYRSVLKTHSYLDAPIASGQFPLLLYNPGWQGERTEGTFQMEDLASHGFIVVAVDHTFYGGKVEFPDGRVADSHNAPTLGSFEHATAQEQAALGAKFVHIEADDDVFVLNQMQSANQDSASPWFHRLDLSRVGAMGFSIGGAVATQVAIQDQRIRAALNLDGWSFGDVQQQGLNKPWMILYEDKSQVLPTPQQLNSGSAVDRVFWRFCQDDYDHVVRGMPVNAGYILFLTGARHVDFTDRSLFSSIQSWTGRGTIGPLRAHAIINAYTLAFFAHVLNGQMEPLLDSVPSPYKEVEIHRF